MSLKALTDGEEKPSLKNGALRVYSMKYCPFAQRTRLVLEAKRIPYETVNINLASKPKWFVEMNPLGQVPVLEKDGKVVYESLVCNDYLDASYPQKLNPTDPYQKARDMMLIERNGKLVTNYYKIIRSVGKDEEAVNGYLAGVEPLEEAIAERGNYFAGDRPGMLDYNLWPFYERTEVIFHLVEGLEAKFKGKYPRVASWVMRMLDDRAVKAVWTPVEKHLAFYQSIRDGTKNYDL